MSASAGAVAQDYKERTNATRAVIASGLGNVMEWYDFGIYGYFASSLSSLFFPSKNALTSLLVTFAVFGVGFVIRPLGGFIFGHYGDKFGRRNVLAFTMVMMGMATFSSDCCRHMRFRTVGSGSAYVLPTGPGVSAGGEWISSTSFIVEYAKENNRGFIGSFQMFSVGLGLLAGSAMGAFVSGACRGGGQRVGLEDSFPARHHHRLRRLYLRLRLDETPSVQGSGTAKASQGRPLWRHCGNIPRKFCSAMGFTINWTVSYYVGVELPADLCVEDGEVPTVADHDI